MNCRVCGSDQTTRMPDADGVKWWKCAACQSEFGADLPPAPRPHHDDVRLGSDPLAWMKQYRCHKVVHAAKITSIAVNEGEGRIIMALNNGASVSCSTDWIQRHKPMTGGYLVVYADGYRSFSPGMQFEDGYVDITATTESKSPNEHMPAHPASVTAGHPFVNAGPGAAAKLIEELRPSPGSAHRKPTAQRLNEIFRHHPPQGDQAERYGAVRKACYAAAIECVERTPCSPEQTRGLNHLQEAMMLFNAAIALNG